MRVFRSGDNEWSTGLGYEKKVIFDPAKLGREGVLLQEVRFQKGERVPPHFHKKQTEIFYVQSSGSIIIGKQRIIASCGDVIVCEPGEIHEIPKVEQEFSFLVFKLDYEDDDTIWL